MTTTLDLGNNESLAIGMTRTGVKEWTAVTLSRSCIFKTERGARMWLRRLGYDVNGTRLSHYNLLRGE